MPTIEIKADRKLIDVRGDRRVLEVRLDAPGLPPRGRAALALAFVLDRSGSMAGGKLTLAKQATVDAIRRLDGGDRFAVVAYDNRIEVPVPATPVSGPSQTLAVELLGRVEPRGSTNLFEGWLAGCEQAAGALQEGAIGKTVLLSDGLVNVGLTNPAEIVRHVAAMRGRGVSTSTLGVGEDFDEVLMADIAEAGGGTFRYVATPEEIPAFVSSVVAEALAISVPGAELVLEGLHDAQVSVASGESVVRDGRIWRVPLGSLVSGEARRILLDVTFPLGEAGDKRYANARLAGRGNPYVAGPVEEELTYASHAEVGVASVDDSILRRRAEIEAWAARRDALRRNRDGDYRGSRRRLEEAAAQLRRTSGGDPRVAGVARRLADEASSYERAMAARERKTRFAQVTYGLKGRDLLGRSSPSRDSSRVPGGRRLVVLPAAQELVAAAVEISEALDSIRPRRFEVVLLPDLLIEAAAPASGIAETLSSTEEHQLVSAASEAIDAGDVALVLAPRRHSDGLPSHWHQAAGVAIASIDSSRAIGRRPEPFAADSEDLLRAIRALGADPDLAEVVAAVARILGVRSQQGPREPTTSR